MSYREKRAERGRKIRAHVELLMEAKAREDAVAQRRAQIRVVGGTDFDSKRQGIFEIQVQPATKSAPTDGAARSSRTEAEAIAEGWLRGAGWSGWGDCV